MNANIFASFAEAAAGRPDRVFLDAEDGVATYADMLEFSARAAGALGSAGVKLGCRVVAQVEKSPASVWLYLGCLRLGAVFIPLNTAYMPAEIGYFLDDAEPALFVCAEATREAVVDGPPVLTLEADGSGSFADALAAADPVDAVAERAADDVAAILYTSGTTGRSKGAMLTHGNLASNVAALTDIWRWRDDDVLLHALPIFHAHGLFVALHCSLYRATTVIFRQKFDAERVLADLPHASVFMGVPTFYARLLKLDGFDAAATRDVRLFISGSAPLTEQVFGAFENRTGQRILERYGMTEALMITSNPYDGARVAGTVGFPLPGVSVRVEADAGDSPGVLEIAGPNVFTGYWRNEEKTHEAFTADGWFRTGDVAAIDEESRVRLVGRSSDLVISGGYNVYPKEIELLIDELPGVEETAVVGVPHPDFGEAVLALVVPQAGERLDLAGIGEAIRDRLASFKRPKQILLLDELPRNAMGKVEKAVLRRRYATLFEQA